MVQLDPEAMAETDTLAPDSWTHGIGTYECEYRDGRPGWGIECFMVFSHPMDLIAHTQEHRADVDHDDVPPMTLAEVFGDVDHDEQSP